MLILIMIETNVGRCGSGKEPSGSTKYGEFLNWLRKYTSQYDFAVK
jgi:hypothetical protein